MKHGTLADIDHDPVVSKSGDYANTHYTCQLDQVFCQAAEITGSTGKHGSDIIVHQRLGKSSPHHSGDGGDQNTEDHQQE